MGRKVKKSSKLLHDLLAVFVAACLCISMVPVLATADPTEEPSTPVSAEESGEETPEPGETPETLQPEETPETPEVVEPQETVDVAVVDAVEVIAEESTVGSANEINAVSMLDDVIAVQALDGVASINGVAYDSLQAAVNAAANRSTILLNEDVYETVSLDTAKAITVDLQGHTIDAQGKGIAFRVSVDGCSVTLKNGSIVNGKFESTYKGSGFAAPKKNVAITIDGVTFVNNDTANGYAVAVGGTNPDQNGIVNISNCKITGSAGGVYIYNKQAATLSNVELTGNTASGNMSSAKEQITIKGLKGVTYTLSNVRVHDNDMRKNGSNIATVKVSAGNFHIVNCRIWNNTAVKVAGLWKDGSTSLTLENTVIANNTCTSTSKPTASSPYTGGLGCALAKSTVTPTPTIKVSGGAIYGNTKNGQPSDVFMGADSNRYGFGFDNVDIVAAESMSDLQNGGNAFFKSYGYQWMVDESSTATYGFTVATAKSTIQADGRIAFDTKAYPKVSSTTSPAITYVATPTREPSPVASLGDEIFLSLSEAFQAANAGDTVKLYFKEGADKSTPIAVSEAAPIAVDKNVTLDANGGFTSGSVTFQVAKGTEFALENSEGSQSTNNGIVLENEGTIVLGNGIDVSSVVNNGSGVLKIEGTHGVVSANVANGSPVELAADAVLEGLNFRLANKTLSSLNNGTMQGDLKLVSCDSADAAKALLTSGAVSIVGKANPLAKLFVEGKDLVARVIAANGIYIGGPSASDSNDGLTPDAPVASFSKAKELLGTSGLQTNNKKIIVVGEVAVTSSEEWNSVNSTVDVVLVRYADYKGALVRVSAGADLTLGDVTLDGGSFEMVNRDARNNGGEVKVGLKAKAPLVIVEKNASLTVVDGALLHSNYNEGSIRGGAIHNEGMLYIDGGTITDNASKHAGGGIYSYGDTAVLYSGNTGSGKSIIPSLIMSGGVISYNQAIQAYDIFESGGVPSAGGGICVAKGGMAMEGGIVTANKCEGNYSKGGGISVGGEALRTDIQFDMCGGEITKNHSGGVGGGVCLDCNAVGNFSAGLIAYNVANDGTTNWTHSMYSGGGIYIEGCGDPNCRGVANIENVEITRNHAASGAGIAACPTTTSMNVHIKDGAVIHENDSGVADIYVATISLQNHGAVSVSLPKYTANGYSYKWLNGKKELATTEELNKTYTPEQNGAVFYSQLTGENAKHAAADCTLRIIENSSGANGKQYYGGGIGCNGELNIGTSSTNLALEKKIEGNANPIATQFDFKIAFTEGDDQVPFTGAVDYYLNEGQKIHATTDEDGVLNVSLNADDRILFCELPAYIHYDVTELTEASLTTWEGVVVKDGAKSRVSTWVQDGKQYWAVDPNGVYEKTENENTGTLQNGFNELIVTNKYLLGDLAIHKNLTGNVNNMSNGEGTSTAVFHVEGFWGEEKIYDNYVGINFSAAGEGQRTLEDLMVGAKYVVSEVVYDGSGYKPVGESVQEFVLEASDSEKKPTITFEFENEISDDNPNSGVVNSYSLNEETGEHQVAKAATFSGFATLIDTVANELEIA